MGIAGRDSFCTSVATGLGRGSLPDFPSPEEGVGGKREGGRRDQFFSQRNSQWLQEGLPGWMPFQLIPNGPPPPASHYSVMYPRHRLPASRHSGHHQTVSFWCAGIMSYSCSPPPRHILSLGPVEATNRDFLSERCFRTRVHPAHCS